MAETTRHIPIDKNSEIGRLLDAAGNAGVPIVLEVNGHSYHLTHRTRTPENPWRDYDADAVKRGLAASAGAFAGIDTDRLKRELREQRGQDSYGRPA